MTDNPWIEWKGGECPIDRDTRVSYRLRDETVCIPDRAGRLDWLHDGVWNDIIAYRVVQP